MNKKEETKKQYDHENRMCEFPECPRKSASGSQQHADGSKYKRPWCKYHLKGKGRDERVEYSKDIKKYKPKSFNLTTK